jgi:hypothetical protein
MPVIGKLDEQVHSILIAPLANPNAAARETHLEEDAPRSETARPREIATNETTEAEERAGAQTSLPVWLL